MKPSADVAGGFFLLGRPPHYRSFDRAVKSLATVVGSSSICSGFLRKALTPARQASRSQSLAESMMIGVAKSLTMVAINFSLDD